MTYVTLENMEERILKERKALGRFIREIREDADPEITQAAAAVKAGITRQHWNRIEKGESGLPKPTVEKMAEALGLRSSDPRFSELFRLAGFLPPNVIYEEIRTGQSNSPESDGPRMVIRRFGDAEVVTYESEFDSLMEAGWGEITDPEERAEIIEIIKAKRDKLRRQNKSILGKRAE